MVSDIAEDVRAALREAGETLGVKESPFNVTPYDLEKYYPRFCTAAETYRQTPADKKPQLRFDIADSFENVEIQAAWLVLGETFRGEAISRMSSSQRSYWLNTLLKLNKEVYPFFEKREKALEALLSAGIISYEECGVSILSGIC
ncbi:hypothetical protein HY638_04370 [Candidatus Woesearchaeota archaeon]|nr:hypothetical protein [Candidatus Woesearchaeota archaeon]